MRDNFYPTHNAEIKVYLGVVVLMGIIKMPKIANYWSTDEQFYFISKAVQSFLLRTVLAVDEISAWFRSQNIAAIKRPQKENS